MPMYFSCRANVPSTVDRLEQCVTAIGDWYASRRLQLNPLKTEFVWFGTRVSLNKIAANDLSLQYNTIQYNRIICNAHKVEYRMSNLRRGQSLGGRGCGRWLTGMRCEECF